MAKKHPIHELATIETDEYYQDLELLLEPADDFIDHTDDEDATSTDDEDTISTEESFLEDAYGELFTTFTEAAREEYLDTIEELITNGADADRYDEMGNTPLMYASINGNIDIVKKLIEAGADINLDSEGNLTAFSEGAPAEISFSGNTALTLAAENGNSHITELLTSIQANTTSADGSNNETLDLTYTTESIDSLAGITQEVDLIGEE